MHLAIPILILLLLVASLMYLMYAWRIRALTSDRLADRVMIIDMANEKRPRIHSIILRFPIFSVLFGVLLLILLTYLGVFILAAIGIALIFGVTIAQIEDAIMERKVTRLEEQLASMVDLMIASLQSNATIPQALEIAAKEIKEPLGPIMEEVANRIQYGDDPHAVLRMLVEKIPTENFHLFATTLSVHWEVGGKLFPVLATVGSAIRDRIEIHRRIRAITAQTRISAVAILLVTYILAFIIYQYDPATFLAFVVSPIGILLVSLAIFLQGVGLLILALMNRIRI